MLDRPVVDSRHPNHIKLLILLSKGAFTCPIGAIWDGCENWI